MSAGEEDFAGGAKINEYDDDDEEDDDEEDEDDEDEDDEDEDDEDDGEASEVDCYLLADGD